MAIIGNYLKVLDEIFVQNITIRVAQRKRGEFIQLIKLVKLYLSNFWSNYFRVRTILLSILIFNFEDEIYFKGGRMLRYEIFTIKLK